MNEEENEFFEPQEDDYVTDDHINWYQYGKLVLTTNVESCEQELRAHMNKERFWPNAWFISDHGNAHLLSLETANEAS